MENIRRQYRSHFQRMVTLCVNEGDIDVAISLYQDGNEPNAFRHYHIHGSSDDMFDIEKAMRYVRVLLAEGFSIVVESSSSIDGVRLNLTWNPIEDSFPKNRYGSNSISSVLENLLYDNIMDEVEMGR